MRIVCISDTHGLHDRMTHEIPEGDVLIHAGDLTKAGRLSDLIAVESFFSRQPHPHKFYVPGNHDWCFEKDPEEAIAMIQSATCLIDQAAKVREVEFWGSPWQPEFHDWAFNLPRGKALAEVWSKIPETTDILITHGPPHGIGDLCSSGEREGCEDLLKRIQDIDPALHVCGHIHEAYGSEVIGNTTFFNASICNLGYKPINAPMVFEMPE